MHKVFFVLFGLLAFFVTPGRQARV